MTRYEQHRGFLKASFNEFKNIKTDKMKGIPQPSSVKAYTLSSNIINLPRVSGTVVKKQNIYECINERRSTNFYLCLN